MKIIIADDEEDIRSMLKFVLNKKGFDVITDPTGELLENLSRDLPDLIIIDINLQSRDGGDICTKLKQQPLTKHIPIILISAIMDLRQISQLCGADDFLMKPFNMTELEEKVSLYSKKAA
jgi:DNA-binding response OmpR family regulator